MTNSITKISALTTRQVLGGVLKYAKYILLPILVYMLYQQVVTNSESVDMTVFIKSKTLAIILMIVLPLMVVNWGIETVKWKTIVKGFESISYNNAVRSVLCGVSLAIVTPGRVGEYGGRLIGISKVNRPKALVANLISSISQNVANVSIGLVGMIAYCNYFLKMNYATTVAICFISGVALLLLLLIYFRLDLIQQLLTKYNDKVIVKKMLQHSQFLEEYGSSQLSKILGLSYLRYGVYTLQYVILVLICGVTHDPIYALVGVTVIFFIQSGLPLPPMLSVLARGEMALWIWAVFSTNVVAILTATFILWAINLVIPTIAGSIILWRSKIV